MANAFVQLPTDGSGKQLQTFSNTIAAQTVHAEAVTPVDSAGVEKATLANPLRVDPTGTTVQPVSGTVSAVQSGLVNVNQAIGVAGFEKITDGTNTAAVKAASTAAVAADSALVVAVSPNNPVAVTGTFFQATQPVSGTVTTAPPANASTNVAQFGGSAVATGTGVGGAGVPRVTVSSDSFPASQAVTNASLANLDVALSTRTKPADQQHTIIDSGSTVVTQTTGTNLHVVVDSAPTTAITAASLPLSTNAAQETGNLATLVSQTRNSAQDADVLNEILAQLKLLNLNFASNMSNGYVDTDSILLDTFVN